MGWSLHACLSKQSAHLHTQGTETGLQSLWCLQSCAPGSLALSLPLLVGCRVWIVNISETALLTQHSLHQRCHVQSGAHWWFWYNRKEQDFPLVQSKTANSIHAGAHCQARCACACRDFTFNQLQLKLGPKIFTYNIKPGQLGTK